MSATVSRRVAQGTESQLRGTLADPPADPPAMRALDLLHASLDCLLVLALLGHVHSLRDLPRKMHDGLGVDKETVQRIV